VINYENIEKYISNELTEQEQLAFEQQLQTDAELAEAYAMYVSIYDTMQSKEVANEAPLLETTTTLNEQYFTTNFATKPLKNNVRRMFFLAAAAAAILVLVFTLLPLGNKKLTNKELYAKYTVHEKVEEITRGDNKDSTFNKAAQLYNAKNFKDAIPLYAKIKDSSSQALFLYGVCNMEMNENTVAIKSFDTLIDGTSTYKEKAELYKALVYLKKNDVENCKKQLLSINKYSSYIKEANALYEKLKK
jgi:hypothetical protein